MISKKHSLVLPSATDILCRKKATMANVVQRKTKPQKKLRMTLREMVCNFD